MSDNSEYINAKDTIRKEIKSIKTEKNSKLSKLRQEYNDLTTELLKKRKENEQEIVDSYEPLFKKHKAEEDVLDSSVPLKTRVEYNRFVQNRLENCPKVTAKWLKQQNIDKVFALAYNADRSISVVHTVIPYYDEEFQINGTFLCFECDQPHRHPTLPIMSKDINDIPDEAVVKERFGFKPLWWPESDLWDWRQSADRHDECAGGACGGGGCHCFDCSTTYNRKKNH